MALINKIDLEKINANVRKLLNTVFDIKLLQEQLEDIVNYIDSNKKYFKNGKISKEIYEENEVRLEENKKKLIDQINKKTEVFIENAEKTRELIGSNRI